MVMAIPQPQSTTNDLSKKSILLLYSFDAGYTSFQRFNTGFQSVVTPIGIGHSQIFTQSLDLVRYGNDEYRRNLAEFLRYKFADHKFDLIITINEPAFGFLLKEGRAISPGTPTLAIAGPATFNPDETARKVVLIPDTLDYSGTLNQALTLFPKTRHVLHINGNSVTERRQDEEATRAFVSWRPRLDIEDTRNLPLETILQRVQSLPPDSIIIFSSFFQDSTGKTFTRREVARRIAQVANAPIFGLYDIFMDTGVLGGSMLSYLGEGERAGQLALDLLRQQKHFDKPLLRLVGNKQTFYDWQQIKRWKADYSQLPANTLFINRPPTLWQQYKWYVIAAVVFFLLQALLISTLLLQRRHNKTVEKALRESDEQLHAIFDQAAVGVALIKSDNGRFLKVNQKYSDIIGYPKHEMLELDFMTITHPDDLTIDLNNMQLMREGRISSFSMEKRYICKDHSIVWVNLTVSPLLHDTPLRMHIAVVEDISRRKLAEEQTTLLQTELNHVARLSTMGEMATYIAHEINQPLTAITNYCGACLRLLQSGTYDVNDLTTALQGAVTQARRGGDVIKHLRNFIGKKETRFAHENISEILREVMFLAQIEARQKNISIHVVQPPVLPAVKMDKILIEQVMINLIRNAMDAMDDKSQEMHSLLIEPCITQNELIIAVKDNGPGVAAGSEEHLFQPFFTTKAQGMGIGLAICRSIIETHGGRLWVEPNQPTGAIFLFSLPLTPETT